MNPDSTCIEREALIKQSLLSGQTYQEIGEALGVKRQRVQQIAKRIGAASCSQALKKQKRDLKLARPCFLCGLPAGKIRSTEHHRLYCDSCGPLLLGNLRHALFLEIAKLLLRGKPLGHCVICDKDLRQSRSVICHNHDEMVVKYYRAATSAINHYPQFDWPTILKKVAEGVRE